jgi:thiol-disulfide isomerase/thioredoxin
MGLLKISVVTCGILLSFLGVCRSDTIQLRSGKEVQATVSKYKNNVFEARSADGKTTSYPANEVSRIQFDPRSSPSKIATRTSGLQEGTVTMFDNGKLTVTQSAGTRTFPAIFIDRVDFVADKGQNIELIARGQQVDIKKHLALGNVTIIDFYAEWCGPCKMISPMLEHLAQTDPEIALRKIDIVTWQSPVARQYNVEGVPRVEVYGRKGQLIGAMQGVNPDGVLKLVAKAKGG